MLKVAINGLGRIGRAALRVIMDTPELELVAVNDLIAVDNLVYLLQYDTVYGLYEKAVSNDKGNLAINGKKLKLYTEKDPAQLPWKKLGIDIVFECTGFFTARDDAQKHIKAGAKRVILSAPSKSEDVVTVVHGVNKAGKDDAIISTASCTTNCITPVIEIIGRRVGIKKAIMTTLHAYTSSQHLVDGPSSKFRKGRAAGANLVPTTTGAAIATTRALPQYKDKFDGSAVRAPIAVGSISDIILVTSRNTSVEEVNGIFIEESQASRYRGILGVARDPIVSSDIIRDPRASIVDLEMTQVVDHDLVKIMSWYDNEWGYVNQMIRTAMTFA